MQDSPSINEFVLQWALVELSSFHNFHILCFILNVSGRDMLKCQLTIFDIAFNEKRE